MLYTRVIKGREGERGLKAKVKRAGHYDKAMMRAIKVVLLAPPRQHLRWIEFKSLDTLTLKQGVCQSPTYLTSDENKHATYRTLKCVIRYMAAEIEGL
jgi:hypothetical protein